MKTRGKILEVIGKSPVTLHPDRQTAEKPLSLSQKFFVLVLFLGTILVFFLNFAFPIPQGWIVNYLITFIALIVFFYAIKILMSLVFATQSGDGSIEIPDETVLHIPSRELPKISVLVPLHKETRSTILGLLSNLNEMIYDQEKLDIMIILEEEDSERITLVREIAKELNLPESFSIFVVPKESFPRTKPNALNYALNYAVGKYTVVYDAEDRWHTVTDKLQLKKFVYAFEHLVDENVVCLQAKLNLDHVPDSIFENVTINPKTYRHVGKNLLAICFGADYAMYFNVILPGVAAMNMPTPLCGTSNCFRTDILVRLGGWDKWNVTEDLDLGMWLSIQGYTVRVLESTTHEEVNNDFGNWIGQRSRWKKGFAQTWLAYMRTIRMNLHSWGLLRFISFQVIVGVTLLSLLMNPILWIQTAVYLVTQYSLIAELHPLPVYYPGIILMVFGNILCFCYLLMGCWITKKDSSIKWMVFAPFYWVLMSIATWRGCLQLISPKSRHSWYKTHKELITGRQS
jgi:cellulose synthase/poly-beta-1,6-N-acetylglucosamine synthase-like glycosyltransferase